MNTLPDPPPGNNPNPTNPPAGGPIRPMGTTSVGGKEKEVAGVSEFPVSGGQEIELPKEVASVGVSMQPTNIPIPQSVSQLGVKPLGQNVPVQPSTGTITLPITDIEIAQGLRQSPMTSWRFLAEWCRRRLKQIGLWKK